jgi:hypothetical protein
MGIDPELRSNEDGSQFGATKIFCGIDEEDVDSFMASNDVKFILNWLGRMGDKYKIDWFISIEGGELGNIINGQVPFEMIESIDALCEAFDINQDTMPCREEILKKYKNR